MLTAFLDTIQDKIKQMNKGGKRSIQKFSEFFMSLTIEKILCVQQSNFIQYIALYIILKARNLFEKLKLQKTVFEKNCACEILFTTCFISELIKQSFPE